jgi:CubicO group peptidase (beta-lactamase class C family)
MVHPPGTAAGFVTPQAAGLMTGPPPFSPGSLVTLANWQDPPFNRWAFQHVRELIPTARIPRGDGPAWRLGRAERDISAVPFRAGDRTMTVADLLAESYTDGFLVLHEGRVVTEQYFNGMTAATPHLLMSVSKSIVGALAGVLAGQRRLDVTAEVSQIVPDLAGTSFARALVQDLLDMRAGTAFNEDYADLDADVRAYERVYLWRPHDGEPAPADALEYFGTLVNDGPHGGPFRYRSILTDVLGWVLERAAGQRLHELIARELWQPMGAEFDAEITVDGHGNAMADGGICATLRDLGRFGQLYLLRGRAGPRQVVSANWVGDTIAGATDGAQAFVAGDNPPGYPPGAHYRNCWWVCDPDLPFYHASGINGQHVFVHEPSQLVVVKLSTWPQALSPELRAMTVAAVTAIARAIGG